MTDEDPSPTDFGQLLRLFESHAKNRWQVWHVPLEGREVYFGRRMYHRNGLPMDRLQRMGHDRTGCCLRCGAGTKFHWPEREPTEFVALRWITLCCLCTGFYIGLWPEIFPRLQVGIRTQYMGWGGGAGVPPGEHYGNRVIYRLDPNWWRLPPFGPAEGEWRSVQRVQDFSRRSG